MKEIGKTAYLPLVLLVLLGLHTPVALGDSDPIAVDRPQPWQMTSFLEDAGLQGGAVFVIDFEADGTVWIAASDGLRRYDGYRWDRFTAADGLPSSYVRSVRVTRAGELWVGTDNGVGVFDGETFDPRNSQGRLAGPSVRRIVEDPDGTLWFACDQWPPNDVPAGLTRLREGTWKNWTSADGLPSDYVSDIFRDSSGDHFILTRRGLARLDEDDRLDRPIEAAGLDECRDYIWSVLETPDGDLVVGTEQWFCVRRNGRWNRRRNESPRISMAQIVVTRDEKVLACTNGLDGQFFEYENDRFTPIWNTKLDTHTGVQFITEAPDGAIWMGGPALLARWDRLGSEWRRFDDLPQPELQDADGGIWFADDDRVLRLAGGEWTEIPGASAPVVRDSSDAVWTHTADGLARWTPGGVTQFDEATIGVEKPRLPALDGAGNLWVVGTTPDGHDCPARFDGESWSVHALDDIKPTETIVTETADTERGVWYVLSDSATELYRLVHVDDETVRDVPLPMVARRYWTPFVHADRSRRLWLYGWMGLYRRDLDADAGEWEPIAGLPGTQVRTAVELGDDVWFSSEGTTGGTGGVSRYHDGVWTHHSIVPRHMTSRREDNMLFIAHARGMSVVTPESAETPRTIAMPESAWVHSFVPGSDGDLWIGRGNHVLHYRPDGVPPETSIVRGEKDVGHGKDLVLQVRGVERFKSHEQPGDFHVSVQLDSGNWGDFRPLSDEGVTITDLTTGDHVVHVRVRDQGMDVDPTPAAWRVRILSVPLQDRIWFLPAAAAVALMLTFLTALSVAAWRREQGQRRRKQALQRQILEISEREQRRIGRDLHDSLGQRLTSISFQCESMRAKAMRVDPLCAERAQEIGAAVREAIAETRGLAQALYPAEIDRQDLEVALGNLVASAEKGFGGACTYRHLWSPSGLSREDSLNVYRLVQEALANAIRHAAAESVKIELRNDDGTWVIEVSDDGKGFDTARSGSGMGLQIMGYRAGLIGGRLGIESRAGKGTTVRCEVPPARAKG